MVFNAETCKGLGFHFSPTTTDFNANPPSKSANKVVIFCSTIVTGAGFSLSSHVRILGLGKPTPLVRKSQILIVPWKVGRLDGNRRRVFSSEGRKAGSFFFFDICLTCSWPGVILNAHCTTPTLQHKTARRSYFLCVSQDLLLISCQVIKELESCSGKKIYISGQGQEYNHVIK